MIFLYLFLIFGIQAETRCRLEAKDKARRKIQMCKNKTNGIKIFFILFLRAKTFYQFQIYGALTNQNATLAHFDRKFWIVFKMSFLNP